MAQAIAGFDAGKCASADGQSSRLEEYLGRHGLRPARIMYTAGELAGLHFVTQSARGLEDAGRGREDIVLCSLDFQEAARSEERRVGKECVSTGRSRW